MTAIKCEFGPICQKIACGIKPINRTMTTISFGCNLTTPQTDVKVYRSENWCFYFHSFQPKVRIEIFEKSSSNIYYPGSFRFVNDYCAMMRGTDNIVTKTFAKPLEVVKKTLTPCPVSGRHMMENVPFDSSLIPSSLLATGDYRLDIREFNERNETIFHVQYFFTVKNPFF
jgi:hypothetical protein